MRLFGSQASLFPRTGRLAFSLVASLFFLWGISNNLTDILVQQFRKSFELSPLQAQLVQTAVFLGYFCMAIPAALLARRLGYKAGILCGLCLFGGGLLLFWPAAHLGRYAPMLLALFLIGCGSATLETTANPYVAQAGPSSTAERRLNFAQAMNPPGTIAGVLLGTYFIFSGIELSPARVAVLRANGAYADYLHRELLRVVPTYVGLGCIVLGLACVIAMVRFPDVQQRSPASAPTEGLLSELLPLLRRSQLLIAMIAQFCCIGAQVSTWSAFIPYLKQYAAATDRSAGLLLSANLLAFACGRFVSTLLMRWFRPLALLTLYSGINLCLLAAAIMRPGLGGAMALIASSFCMSVMFPTIFALGIHGMGKHTELASSLLVMSVIGGATVPPLLGLVAKHTASYSLGYLCVEVCYVVVLAYGLLQLRIEASHPPRECPV
ncbi:L-fucose:H+ symporter permease [Acidipila sp. EB88]|uniref:L-fucose:H+ symporter permease n=1 Tax=Acidipila sp. EB88 TaxID=2305226 RepID=UPI001F1F67E6|nr:L-fucose:H+ symporter permease [Acidipila sp. EB88]